MSEPKLSVPPTAYSRRQAWWWIPSLYFIEGLPNVVVATVSVLMYKSLDVSNSDIALYTSLLYLPWVIKPLWSPFVDNLRTKRWWTVVMQFLLGVGMAGVALSLVTDHFFVASLCFFWVMAFCSATHDIAADGFYLLAVPESDQAWFVGIRSTCYRMAMIAGQGLLVILVGILEVSLAPQHAWLIGFLALGVVFFFAGTYHSVVLPQPRGDIHRYTHSITELLQIFGDTFASFFRKPGIGPALAFLLLYRFAEAQLTKIIALFLRDPRTEGGLGLTTDEVGWIYGTIGVAMLLTGGICGGILASRQGLRHWMWWMVAAINLPNLVYVFLSQTQPESLYVIGTCVAIEQLGYGFGFTAYMLYMLYLARGEHETAHYAICTGFMALGMMLPGMVSGKLQELFGYEWFFLWVVVATIPSFVVCSLIKIDPNFGRNIAGVEEEPIP